MEEEQPKYSPETLAYELLVQAYEYILTWPIRIDNEAPPTDDAEDAVKHSAPAEIEATEAHSSTLLP